MKRRAAIAKEIQRAWHHVSSFINPQTGWLVLLDRDRDGNVIRDSMKVIYPGAGGDPWWDCKQLL